MIKQFVSSELQNVMVNMGLSCLFLVFLGGVLMCIYVFYSSAWAGNMRFKE